MPKVNSLAYSIGLLPEQDRHKAIDSLSQKEAEALLFDWEFFARDNQLPPKGDWLVWLIMTGRGWGKTRTAAEFINREVKAGHARYISLVAKTPADARDVMLEGESGILPISPPWFKPLYEPSKRRITWPNGAVATVFSSADPDQLRGPQSDLCWGDEIRTWYHSQETWDNMMLGLRLGDHPRVVATTTPLPIALIRSLIASPTTVVTRGTSYENRGNLAPSFYSQIIARYEGTRLGRQEINAELLEDVPGALWRRSDIRYKPAPDLVRVVVAIDPASTSGEGADETGIIAAGRGIDGFWYILADRSCRVTPDGWARRAIQAYRDFRADRIIGETNNGGEMVELTLRTIDKLIPYKAVHASRGKQARAEPISALFEQGRVFHTQPFPELEDELCTWTSDSGESPDRLDALVWALSELAETGEVAGVDLPELTKKPEFANIRGKVF